MNIIPKHFKLLLLLASSSVFSGLLYSQDKKPSDYVVPNLGSVHSRWFFYTPAALPFGMAKLGPSTNAHLGNKWGWEATGYDDRHTSIEGFAHFHEFQIGGLVLMPTIGSIQTVPGSLEKPDEGYRSRFNKANEKAKPGYYSVLLSDYSINAELTARPRVGFCRFTYPQSGKANLIFDIGNRQGESGKVLDAMVQITESGEIEGVIITHPEYIKSYQPGAVMKMYFVAQINKNPIAYGAFNKDKLLPGQNAVQGPGAGLYLTFDTGPHEEIEIKTGLSYTSIANARINLAVEATDMDFDTAQKLAEESWEQALGRIHVKGGEVDNKVKFYTGLYHALLGRGLASDVSGAYPKNDGGIGQIELDASGKPTYHHYNTDAIWGAFWNLTQLWALVYPRYLNDFVRTQLDHYRDCGWLADGVAAGKFVSGVGTNFMGQVVASTYLRGIRDYDIELAYNAVMKNEIGWQNRPLGVGKADTKIFTELGYVPYEDIDTYYSGSNADGSKFSASHTLEYSFSAYAAGQMASVLGHKDDLATFDFLAKGWKRLFEEKSGFIQPKLRNGDFIEGFDPKEAWKGFQEGNSWQYTFYVPHDPAGLIQKLGKDAFNRRLNQIFEDSEKLQFGGGKDIDAFSGVSSPYNHGNQPSLHISFLFNYSGKPWLSQKWVRSICNDFYGTTATHGYGYGQDEDQGQIGAWFVLAGMGLFDVQGGANALPNVQITSPLFERITVTLDPDFYAGSQFEIVTHGDPLQKQFIKRSELNGEPLDNCWLNYVDIVNGGRLDLWMGEKPNLEWGVAVPPPSMNR